MSQALTVTVLSHHGAVRTRNEDAVCVGGLLLLDSRRAVPLQVRLPVRAGALVALADGLGGHAGGRLAAELTVRQLAERVDDLGDLAAVVSAAHERVCALARDSVELREMGSTLVGLHVTEETTRCFNVGDSPAYRLSGGYLEQLATLDTPGRYAEEAGHRAVASTLVTQVIGPGAYPPVAHIAGHPTRAGARYLLCSDGLTDLVPLEALEQLLAENALDDARAVRAMWGAAMNAGGRDNITIALAVVS